MKKFIVLHTCILGMLISAFVFGPAFAAGITQRKGTLEDLHVGPSTLTVNDNGHVGHYIPYPYAGSGTTDNSAVVEVRAHTSFSAAIAAASGKTLLVSSEVTVSDNTTIDNTVSVLVLRGGSFNISTGITLTISGPFSAGIYKVFTCNGTGNVAWTGTPVTEVNVEWFTGNIGYSFMITPKTTELQKAFDSLPTISGAIKFNTLVPIDNTITIPKYAIHVSGIATSYSYIRGSGVYNAGIDTPALKFTNPNAIYINYLTVVGTKGYSDPAGNAHGIWFSAASSAGLVHVNNSFVEYNKGDGIKFTGAIYGELFVQNSSVTHNGNGINSFDISNTGNALTIQNNQISVNDNNGILWGKSNVLNILNNTMEANHPTPNDNTTGHAIYIKESGGTINIQGNYFEDYGANHIEFFADTGKTISGIKISGNSFIVGAGLIDEDHAMVKFSGSGTISNLNYDASNVGPTYLFDGGGILDSSCVVPFDISAGSGDTFAGGYYWKNWGNATTSKHRPAFSPTKTRACVSGATATSADNVYSFRCVTNGNWTRTVNDNTY